jgi:hypothetical protein
MQSDESSGRSLVGRCVRALVGLALLRRRDRRAAQRADWAWLKQSLWAYFVRCACGDEASMANGGWHPIVDRWASGTSWPTQEIK